ncbi:MAG: MerR family transcriptional regulator [Xanthobacteraceae bacterium]
MEKAPDAFRTISEVADEIDVPQHVLRFWESRFSHIRPMKRGGGRRYYRPDDVDLLRGIRHLLYGEGYTIRGVQRILREDGGAFVQNVWRVGAEPAPPPLEEDAQDAASGAAEDRAEPSLFSEPGETVPAAEDNIGSGANRRKLEMALDELIACRRIIDGVLQQD